MRKATIAGRCFGAVISVASLDVSAAITFKCNAAKGDECVFSIDHGGVSNFRLGSGQTQEVNDNMNGSKYCVVAV